MTPAEVGKLNVTDDGFRALAWPSLPTPWLILNTMKGREYPSIAAPADVGPGQCHDCVSRYNKTAALECCCSCMSFVPTLAIDNVAK